jgi:hypothetical protein
MTPEEIKMSAWNKSIDVQMHFNNIELQIRNYALTLFTAVIAGIGYLLKEKIDIVVLDFLVPSSAAAAFIGMIIMCTFYFMDKYWYHVLLKGSVLHAMAIEQMMSDPSLRITSAIGMNSKVKLMGWNLESNTKYYFFYYPLILIFLGLYLALLKWA